MKFGANDFQGENTTIEQWVHGREAKSSESQVTRYFAESPVIAEFRKDEVRQFHGHLVLIVGNRMILIWDVDNGGKLRNARLIGPWEGNW